jgi:CRISPR-associated protein Csb1
VTSEIVGIQAEKDVHTSSRIDPLAITKAAEIFKTKDGDWTLQQAQAEKTNKGEPVKAKPSDFVHGNIPPTIERDEYGHDSIRGGVTIHHAIQTTVLSLPALRRLRFRVREKETVEGNNAAVLY